jgi:hypothetical protein
LIGSITVGSSFFGLLTPVEIGQILVTAELRRDGIPFQSWCGALRPFEVRGA